MGSFFFYTNFLMQMKDLTGIIVQEIVATAGEVTKVRFI